MRWKLMIAAVGVMGVGVAANYAMARQSAAAQQAATAQRAEAAAGQSGNGASEAVTTLVGRLELEKYKATVKGLTEFGDRRQGTDRNRKAVDWIEAQLKSYGCTNTARIRYDYQPPPPRDRNARRPARPAGEPPMSVGGGRPRGNREPTGVIEVCGRGADAGVGV